MRSVALIALTVVLLEAVADVLPDEPLVGFVTPLRLVVGVGLLALLASVRRVDLRSFAWRAPFDVLVVLLLGAAALAARISGTWSDWRGLLTCVAIAYLAAGVLRSTPEAWRAVTILAFACTATAALTGVRQTVTGERTGFCRGGFDGASDHCGHADVLVRADGTFGNPNLLAAFLVLMLPLALAAARSFAQAQARTVGYVVVAAGVAGIVATGSRAGMLALVVLVAAHLVLHHPSAARLAVGAAAAVVTTAFGVGAAAFGAPVGVRSEVWRAAAGIVAHHPWGVGLGRSGAAIQAAVPGPERFAHAHNLWLDELVETGPLGLAATLGLTALLAVMVARAARRGSRAAVVLGTGLAGFAAMSLVDDPSNAIRNAYALWAVIGLTVASGVGLRADDGHGAPSAGDTTETGRLATSGATPA